MNIDYQTLGLEKKDNPFGIWVTNKDKTQPNDVHVLFENEAMVIGHNNQYLEKVGGTPLCVSCSKGDIEIQYAKDDKNIDFVKVDPELFYNHVCEFLLKLKDAVLSNSKPNLDE